MDNQAFCNIINTTGANVSCGNTVFLALLSIHILGGLTCVVTGIVAMLSQKRAGRHPTFGTIYYWSLSLVFVTASALSAMRWSEDGYLFVLGALSFIAATLGRMAHQRRWRNWVKLHITGMGSSYILLLTAFYVDNGKHLPIWKELPSIVYWLLPSAIGIPLIVRTLLRHPVVLQSKASPRATGSKVF